LRGRSACRAQTSCGRVGLRDRLSQRASDEPGFSPRRKHGGAAGPHYPRAGAGKAESRAGRGFPVDFEDGYGNRPTLKKMATPNRPQLKSFGACGRDLAALHRHSHQSRSRRVTLRQRAHSSIFFVSTVVAESGGRLPDNFVVTLPNHNARTSIALGRPV